MALSHELHEAVQGGIYREPESPELSRKAQQLRSTLFGLESSAKASRVFLERYLRERTATHQRALSGEAAELWDLAFAARRQIMGVLKEK